MKCSENEPTKERSLDTLAQGGTEVPDCDIDIVAKTTVDDKRSLRKRAGRKFKTGTYLFGLIDASESSEKSTLIKSYWNTYHCARELTLRSDGKVTGHYCKNRWCLVCNAIRTAQLINRYTPVLNEWEDKYFVTTTPVNCSAGELPVILNEMNESFKRINDRLKKQHKRGQSEKFMGVRKLEVTYSPYRNDFHPHNHFIVNGKDSAKKLVDYWLEDWNKNSFDIEVRGAANPAGQDIRPADERSVLELFKYFTKVTTGKADKRKVYADAMDIIFNAVKGKQVFKPFGFRLPKEDPEGPEIMPEDVYAIMEYTWDENDWTAKVERVDYDTGEIYSSTDNLTGYELTEEDKSMAESLVFRKEHDWTPTFRKPKQRK